MTKLPRKKQSTRLIKCMCDVCGYVTRTTRKWLDRDGPPRCPAGHGVMTEQDKGENK